MNHALQEIAEVIKSDPGVANVVEGTGGSGATNTAFIYMALKPLAERKVSATDIINRLRPKLDRLPVPSVVPPARTGYSHRRAVE
jgi:multidrug efflux pump